MTLVPYMCAWASLELEPLREALWTDKVTRQSTVPVRLRRHFGVEDWDAVASVDVLDDDGLLDQAKLAQYYRLPDELPTHERAAAERVEAHLANDSVKVRALPIDVQVQSVVGGWLDQDNSNDDSTTFNNSSMAEEGEVLDLPASTVAKSEILLQHLSSRSSDQNRKVAMVAIDFLADEDKEQERQSAADGALVEDDNHAASEFESSSTATSVTSFGEGGASSSPSSLSSSSKKDPLLGQIHTYSTWYHQPELQHLQSSSSSSSSDDQRTVHHVTASITDEEIRLRTLEADVDRLEIELRDLTARRPYDDIRDELDATKATLRRLKWKKWVPW